MAALLSIAVLLLHLRLFASAGPLWRDEINSLVVATQPSFELLWARLDTESFPLLPFALLRGWCALLGTADSGLRLLGLGCGTLILGALWLARRLLGPSVPLLSLGLFAVSPVVIRWGDAVRGYGLAVLTVLLAFLMVFRAVRRPRALDLALATVAAVASVQALYQNAVLVFAICTSAAVVCLRRGRRLSALLALGIGGVAALSLLPYSGVVARSRETTVVSVEDIDLASLLGVASRALGTDPGLQGPIRGMPWAFALILAGALLAGVLRQSPRLWRASRRRRDLVLYALLVLAIAVPLHFALLLRVGFRTQPWYYLTLMGLGACCIEAILEVRSSGWRLVRVAAVGAFFGLVVPGVHAYLGLRQTNADWAVAALGSPSEGDLVVLTPWYYGVSFNRYYHGAAPWTMLPPLEDRSLHRPDLVKRLLAEDDPAEPVLRRARETLSSGHRVYLVGSLGGRVTEAPPRLPPAPGVETGWWQGTYAANWSARLQFELQNHARSARGLPVTGSQGVIPYEILSAWVVEGWR